MDTKKREEFVKATLETFRQMKSGERCRLRARLKVEDRYIRHTQKFFYQGDQNGMVHVDHPSCGGVLQSVSDAGGNNGEGAPRSDTPVDNGEKADIGGTDKSLEGRVCEGTVQEGRECTGSEGQAAQA